MANIQPLGNGHSITCHAWNVDGTKVALCPNTNEVLIYCKKGTTWDLEHTLTQHDSVVTGIDWAPKTNRIVSCSQDRNAYVWTLDEESHWKPVLVILRINRAATDVKWSPNEDKFAVASGAKAVSVCHYEEDNEWWVSKHIKKHGSTILRVAWHPNNTLLATTSTDFKARVFGAAIRGVDKKPEMTVWGDPKIFGEPLMEFDCNGWTHGIAFSPSGNKLCFTGHDSSIYFVEPVKDQPPVVTTIRLTGLPLLDVLFLDETKVVGAGHDCMPLLFSTTGLGVWAFVKSLDEKPKVEEKSTSGESSPSSNFEKFQNMAGKGTNNSSSLSTTLETKHQNTITCISAYKRVGAKVSEFTTSGLDGNIIFWK
jgi:actin related protein 2/3 complex subunit 1A/1B